MLSLFWLYWSVIRPIFLVRAITFYFWGIQREISWPAEVTFGLNFFKMKRVQQKRDFGFQKSEPTASVKLGINLLAAANTNLKGHGKV